MKIKMNFSQPLGKRFEDYPVLNSCLLPGLVGTSACMQELVNRIVRIRNIDSTVLIQGQSGTGKEVIAHALHATSNRATMPFCAINCGAIPESLLESELFGHRKGAFTDAKADRKGLFETAGKGTILLDEIGDMPASLQMKLLRVLQEKNFTPVGATQPVPLLARILCATHKNLAVEVEKGRFRQDLFFRINVLLLQAPPLEDRIEDIPLLVRYFLEKCNQRFAKNVHLPNQAQMADLKEHAWIGNVRELQNSLERAVAMSEDGFMHEEDLFLAPECSARKVPFILLKSETAGAVQNTINLKTAPVQINFDLPYAQAKLDFERLYLVHQLYKHKGNISEVSKAAGKYRADMYRLIEKHSLQMGSYRI